MGRRHRARALGGGQGSQAVESVGFLRFGRFVRGFTIELPGLFQVARTKGLFRPGERIASHRGRKTGTDCDRDRRGWNIDGFARLLKTTILEERVAALERAGSMPAPASNQGNQDNQISQNDRINRSHPMDFGDAP